MNVGQGPQDSSPGTGARHARPESSAAAQSLARCVEARGDPRRDPTGTLTCARYLWQAKLAVLHWLNSLADDDALRLIIADNDIPAEVVEPYGDRAVLELSQSDRQVRTDPRIEPAAPPDGCSDDKDSNADPT